MRIFLALCLLFIAACDAGTTAQREAAISSAPVVAGLPGNVTVEAAPEWTDLFDTTSGWTGADGIFSIPVNGVETPGAADATRTIFLFSDTVIGDVRPDGSRAPGARIVNNTAALLGGGSPDAEAIEFFWRGGRDDPRALVAPDTPDAAPGQWYWNGDGIVLGTALWAYAFRMQRDGGGTFGFEQAGVNLVRTSLIAGVSGSVQQFDTPLFRPPQDGRGDLAFGGAILPNLAEAGVPDPDGYLYVYGVRNDAFNKKLLVARVRPEDIATFGRYRYWDGSRWVTDLDAAVPVTSRVSNELSVTPLANGQYLMVFQRDAISRVTAARVGESPVGPWGPVRDLYSCPEALQDSDTFCYNAKAHPHVSAPGTLLISYNVNTFDFFGDFFADADLYRPRFIRLRGLPR